MRALVTGITGFVGSHLAEYLLTRPRTKVYGIYRWRSRMENIAGIRDRITLLQCDLLDAAAVYRVLDEVRPDTIFHLAAQSYVPMSWVAPAATLELNVISQVNICEALRQLKLTPRIHIAGSSEEYGLVRPDEVPIKETNPLRPLSPYGVSKVAQDLLGYQYFKSYGQPIVRTRAFNHTGPRRGDVFVTSNFAIQFARIEKGLQPPVVTVGNLDAVRDFLDVRDVVRAYELAVTRGEPGEVYNICTGTGHKIRVVVEILQGLASVKVKIKTDPARMRPSDVELLIGDPTRFMRQTGWKPAIPFEKTMEDLLNFWRARVGAPGGVS